MEIISNPTQGDINMAANALKDGHLVAFPTETVYGLGADATNEKSVSRIYSVKGRPINHPLIVHISSINQLDKWAIEIPECAIKLAAEFWPGPMTLILKRNKIARDFITGGQDSIALRVPDHPVTLKLLNIFEALGGEGLAAPSANRFGALSPTNSNEVNLEIGEHLGANDLILNGGQCLVGIESTIINCTEHTPKILRPGAITELMIERSISTKIKTELNSQSIRTSGAFKSHYSPIAQVVLDSSPNPGEGFLALKNVPTPPGSIRLASPISLEEFANVLYSALRLADIKGIRKISVIAPEGSGLAAAIRDRLNKASGL